MFTEPRHTDRSRRKNCACAAPCSMLSGGGGGTRRPPGGGWCAPLRVNVFGCLRWQPPFLRSIVLSKHLRRQLQQPGPHLGRLATSCDKRSTDHLTWAEIKTINRTINSKTLLPLLPPPRKATNRRLPLSWIGLTSPRPSCVIDVIHHQWAIYGAPSDRLMRLNFNLKRRKRFLFASLHVICCGWCHHWQEIPDCLRAPAKDQIF